MVESVRPENKEGWRMKEKGGETEGKKKSFSCAVGSCCKSPSLPSPSSFSSV